MIVRERSDSFLLFEQHEHALIAGEFALRWRERPRPFESTVYAIANHDLAWREADREVLWNEEKDRPYSFVDYPLDLKLPAQRRGIDLVAAHDPYAGCLCSIHYARFLLDSERPEEIEFREGEVERQDSLEVRMSEEELENLERNFRFLRLSRCSCASTSLAAKRVRRLILEGSSSKVRATGWYGRIDRRCASIPIPSRRRSGSRSPTEPSVETGGRSAAIYSNFG
jgi:hypothetical protein